MTEIRAPRRRYRGTLAIGNAANAVIVTILGIFTLSCLLPIFLIYISSFAAERVVTKNGFSFFLEEWSVTAYEMLFGQSLRQIATSYLNTIVLTVLGAQLDACARSVACKPRGIILGNKSAVLCAKRTEGGASQF